MMRQSLLQLMDAMEKADQAALTAMYKEAHLFMKVVSQLDCQMLSLAPSIALYLDF